MQSSLISLYLALSLAPNTFAPSAEEMQRTIYAQAPALQGHGEKPPQVTEEVARAAGGEMHNISAVLGGMVAQEVIKVVTEQYIPVDNTCIFDGIRKPLPGIAYIDKKRRLAQTQLKDRKHAGA